jgi:hypothetical protein
MAARNLSGNGSDGNIDGGSQILERRQKRKWNLLKFLMKARYSASPYNDKAAIAPKGQRV